MWLKTLFALALCAARAAYSPALCVNTVAGGLGGTTAPTFSNPSALTLNRDGFVLLTATNQVLRLDDNAASAGGQTVTALAGSSSAGYAGDGGFAYSALLNSAAGIALAPDNITLYVVDELNSAIRAISGDGIIRTIAGNGTAGFSGDGGAATAATFWLGPKNALYPPVANGLLALPDGRLVLADTKNHVLRSISAAGVVTSIVGKGGVAGWAGDGGPAAAALLNFPTALALAPNGDMVVCDTGNLRIRRISAATGVVSHVAGTGADASGADGAPAATSPIRAYTTAVAVDPLTLAIVFGELSYKYRSISAAGVLSTLVNAAGNRGTTGDGGPALLASVDYPNGQILFTPFGDLLFLDTSNALLRVLQRSTGRVELLLSGAGSASASAPPLPVSSISNIPGASTPINNPRSMAMARDGTLLIADYGAQAILALAPNGSASLVGGNGTLCPSGPLAACGVPGPAVSMAIKPYALAVGDGQEVFANNGRYIVRIDRAAGSVAYLAGSGATAASAAAGPDGPAATTAINPTAMALDAAGNLYFAEAATYRIRVLGLTGLQSGAVYTVVDSSASLGGYTLATCPALSCSVGQAYVGMAFLPDGSLVFPDNNQYSVLYRLHPNGTQVSRFAGLPWSGASGQQPVGPTPHNVSALSVYLNQPYGICVDSLTRDVFFAGFDRKVLQVDVAGTIWTLAGSGGALSTGDGGAPLAAGFQAMRGLALDSATGNLFAVELGRIREVVRGPTLTCPVGYSCPCGLRPVPCTDPSSVCRGGRTAPALVPPSMYSLGMPALPAPAPGALAYYDVAPCAAGSYCSEGLSRVCPPGTYGRSSHQSTISSCQACPVNTYSAQPRTPCYPCAPGFFAPFHASSFCTACPPGTATFGTALRSGSSSSSNSNSSSNSSNGVTLLLPSALFCSPCVPGSVSGYGAAACTPVQGQASTTDTRKLLPPTFAFQRSLSFSSGNADPSALQALYTVTAVPIVGFFGIPLGLLGLLYGIVWALGSWEGFWAPPPPGTAPSTWRQKLRSLLSLRLPTLPKLPTREESKRWLVSLVPPGVYVLLGLAPPKPAAKAKEAAKVPTPATLQKDIDGTIDALLAAAFEDPCRAALLARLKELRALLMEAETPKKEEKRGEEAKVEEKREVPQAPAATWVGRRRQAWESTLAHYAPLLERADIYCAIKNEIQRGLKVQVSKPTSLGGGVSILFIGVLLAVTAMLVEQFILSNNAATTGSIKLTAWEIGALARYPPFVQALPDLLVPDAPLLPGPGLTSGLQVTVRTHGARCGAPLKVEGLMAVANFTARAPIVDSATAAAVHVYDCALCVADSLSRLTLTFDPSCAAFDISAAAIGAWGTFSMLQITAPNASGLTASFSVLPQQVLDFIGGSDPSASGFPTGGRSARGAFINSGSLLASLPYNASAVAAGAAPPTVLTLLFPSTDLFTRVTLDVRLTILQLINGLLGNLGVLGGAVVLYAILAKLYDACKAGFYSALMAILAEAKKYLGCAPLPAELLEAADEAQKTGEKTKALGQSMYSQVEGLAVGEVDGAQRLVAAGGGALLVASAGAAPQEGKDKQAARVGMQGAVAPREAVEKQALQGFGGKGAAGGAALAAASVAGLDAQALSGSSGRGAGVEGSAGGSGCGSGSAGGGSSSGLLSSTSPEGGETRDRAPALSPAVWVRQSNKDEHWFVCVATGATTRDLPPGAVLQQDALLRGAINPLYKGGAVGPEAAASVSPGIRTRLSGTTPAASWRKCTDGREIWYENDVTGESYWDLPPGSVLQREAR
jgi:hypothetical protein